MILIYPSLLLLLLIYFPSLTLLLLLSSSSSSFELESSLLESLSISSGLVYFLLLAILSGKLLSLSKHSPLDIALLTNCSSSSDFIGLSNVYAGKNFGMPLPFLKKAEDLIFSIFGLKFGSFTNILKINSLASLLILLSFLQLSIIAWIL